MHRYSKIILNTKQIKFSLIFTIPLLIGVQFACNTPISSKKEVSSFADGYWKGIIDMQGQQLPFIFIKKGDEILLQNGEEQISLNTIIYFDDSVSIPLHIFDARIVAKVSESSLNGYWVKDYLEDYKLPFRAQFGIANRFKDKSKFSHAVNGNWKVSFINNGDTTPALAIFEDNKDKLTGTFLTPTGDYRFLEGIHKNDSIYLSTFDGSHAFLFNGKVENNIITGNFWSGKNWHERWVAERNEDYQLPDPEKLTYIIDKSEEFDFSFPLPDGDSIGPRDVRFENKVLIVQILGSWCPNCMDETKFFVQWLKKNGNKDVAILGLAYEAKDDFNYAVDRIEKMKKRMGIEYPIVIAGTKDKVEASKTLPMLNEISSFPTTIILDKNKVVRKIHTGFSGPGTGKYYEKFVDDFQVFIDKLVNEKENS